MGLYIGNMQNTILPAKVRAVLDEDVPMYGLKYDSVADVNIRTYDAADLVFEPSVKNNNTYDSTSSVSAITAGRDDFRNLAPFNVRECYRVYDNGEAVYYYKHDYTDVGWHDVLTQNQVNSTDDAVKSIPTGGLAMIEFPEFWYKRVHIGDGGFEIIVSPQYKQGFTPDPWHYHNGVHYNKRYISKYPAPPSGQNLGVNYYTPRSITYFRDYAYPKGLRIIYPEVYFSLLMLMMVKYGTTSIQDIFGNGNHGKRNYANPPGYTLGMDDGYTLGKDNDASSIVMMGIENFYGHTLKILDACVALYPYFYLADIDAIAQSTDLINADMSQLYYLNFEYTDNTNSFGSYYRLYNSEYDWLFPVVKASTTGVDMDKTQENALFSVGNPYNKYLITFGGDFASNASPMMVDAQNLTSMTTTFDYGNNSRLSTFYVC